MWTDKVRVNNSLGTFPYLLVIGQELVFLLNLKILLLKFVRGYVEKVHRVQVRLMKILEMDKKRMMMLEHVSRHHVVVECWFNKRATIKTFMIFYLVFIWDKVKENLESHTKFQHLWIDPYQIAEILGNNTFRLCIMEGEYIPFLINDQFLKHYFENNSKINK